MWTRSIVVEIRARLKGAFGRLLLPSLPALTLLLLAALSIPRYKFVVQVTLGEVRDQGVRVASRCLWDTDTDNYASYSFKSETIWCNALVFGVYTE